MAPLIAAAGGGYNCLGVVLQGHPRSGAVSGFHASTVASVHRYIRIHSMRCLRVSLGDDLLSEAGPPSPPERPPTRTKATAAHEILWAAREGLGCPSSRLQCADVASGWLNL